MLTAFADFKRAMTGKNPQAVVQSLLDSGQMTHAQYIELMREAKALQSLLR